MKHELLTSENRVIAERLRDVKATCLFMTAVRRLSPIKHTTVLTRTREGPVRLSEILAGAEWGWKCFPTQGSRINES